MDAEGSAASYRSVKPVISQDIDSFIWITRDLRTKGPLRVFTAPPTRLRNFHINRSIHCSIEVQLPHIYDVDKDEVVKNGVGRIPVSGIPHVCLGYVGDTPVLWFFTRLKLGKRKTTLPKPLQDFLWDKIIGPSVTESVEQEGRSPYISKSLEEERARHGNDVRFLSVDGQNVPRLVALCRRRLRESEWGHLLESNFFGMDRAGIKEMTHTVMEKKTRGVAEDPRSEPLDSDVPPFRPRGGSCLDKLRAGLPDLDWAYMENRNHGELLLDYAVSWHPDKAVCGFWKTKEVLGSFEKCGISRPNIYTRNTMTDICSMTGSPTESVTRATGILYWQLYCLTYEITRTKGDDPCWSDSDAANMTANFQSQLNRLDSLHTFSLPSSPSEDDGHHGAASGFGVRSEHRVIARVAEDLVNNCSHLVSPSPFYDGAQLAESNRLRDFPCLTTSPLLGSTHAQSWLPGLVAPVLCYTSTLTYAEPCHGRWATLSSSCIPHTCYDRPSPIPRCGQTR